MSMTLDPAKYPKTVKALSEVLGVSQSTIYKWKQAGLEEVRGSDGRFDPGDVRVWVKAKKKERMSKRRPPMEIKEDNQQRIRSEKTELARESQGLGSTKESEDQDLEEEKDWSNEYRKARAQRETLTVSKLKKELISRQVVEDMFADRAREVKQSILSLGRRLAPRLLGMNAREIENEIGKETRRICLDYSREIPKT
jgi:hypothetical protein